MGSAPSLLPGQRATISPQAAEFLSNLKSHIPFADYLSSFITRPAQIPRFRIQLQQRTTLVEEGLIERYQLKVARIFVAEIPVVVITPSNIKPENEPKIIVNMFGGGFVMGNPRDRTALLMAAEMGIRVYSIDYALAPEARYPVARDQCLAVYRQLVQDFKATNILGMSSSAGGQLMLSMLLLAREENLPMLAGHYLCTPAADLSGDGDSLVANAGRDIMPASFPIEMVKQNYANPSVNWKDTLYSPMYAEYDASFPPAIITVGTRDLLLSTGVRLYWKLREAGVRVELLVSEGMWHGFNWEADMPEAVQVRKVVRDFLHQC